MNKANIKAILESRGWEDVEMLIKEERDKPIEINKDKSMEEIGKETVAKERAKEIINNIIKRLYSVKNEIQKKNISYK